MTTLERPIIGITMGDAAGIGPEIILKALAQGEVYALCRPLVIGDAGVLGQAMGFVEQARVRLRAIRQPQDAAFQHGAVDVLDLANLELNQLRMGQVCPAAGKAAVEYIVRAVELAQAGHIQAIVTAPINKEAVQRAGYEDMGHLELMARLTGAGEVATMLAAGPLRVVHLTTHHSLRRACELVTRERVLARLQLAHRAFQSWGYERPRIGVAALNPHAGEGGLLGREEIEEIGTAVVQAQAQGIDAVGPFPADSIFHRALKGEFDAVLAMYHDQGHIPVKVHAFEDSVSIALGLPILRTSVDHGTAFDIAGQGIASPRSLLAAIKTAVELWHRQQAARLRSNIGPPALF